MSQTGSAAGWADRAAHRLWLSRFILLAAALALFAVTWASGAPAWTGIVAFLLVCAAAALAPGFPAAAGSAEETMLPANLAQLSAADLAEAISDPIVIFDAGGLVIHANHAAVRTFGPTAAGLSVRLKFRAPEIQSLIGLVLDPTATPEAVEFAERVPVERLFRVSAAPVGPGGSAYALVFKDQSEVRRIDRMRADFIANASHELRTPLASIAGFIETLRGPARNDAEARDSFLQIMEGQTGRMARLIDDLLSLSRLETKPQHRPGDTVDLGEIVAGVADALGPLAAELDVTMEKAIPAARILVAGDRDELFQVFENLVENACKYGQSGKRVTIAVESSGDEATVSVRDFGPGIAREHIPRITERFYRADAETSRAQKGTGLGLAIVKHILTRHNARLSIWSELGEGARFTTHFPLAAPATASRPPG